MNHGPMHRGEVFGFEGATYRILGLFAHTPPKSYHAQFVLCERIRTLVDLLTLPTEYNPSRLFRTIHVLDLYEKAVFPPSRR